MKLISKEQFLEMLELGILKGNDKNSKTWSICGIKKGSKSKNRYVDEVSYKYYLEFKGRDK